MSQDIQSIESAIQFTNDITGGAGHCPLNIKPDLKLNSRAIRKVIAAGLEEVFEETANLPSHCFLAACHVSYDLFKYQIRHTVTIGDVMLKGGMFANMTLEGLRKNLANGYEIENIDGQLVGKSVDAHAWVTLEDGSVIDATILASQHYKGPNRSEKLSFLNSIYYSGKPDTPVVKYYPLLIGTLFYRRVLMHPNDGMYRQYLQWVDYYDRNTKFLCGTESRTA